MRRIVVLVVLLLVAAACSSSGSSGKKASQPNATPPPTSDAPTTSAATTPRNTTPAGPNLANANVALTTVASGLRSPVDIAWRTGDKRMYVVEQTGSVRIVGTDGKPLPKPVLTVKVSHGNEQGLLGATFSSDGTKLYVDYTDPNGDTHIDEYTMNGDVAGARRELLFQKQPFPNHNGGEVIFGPDRMLYIGLGDGGSGGDPFKNAQNLDSLLGKILRINPAASGRAPYTIPADNPFVGRNNARPEVFMYGLRNPWRFSFDRANGDMWIGDVGQDAFEEIDFAKAGDQSDANWGWNLREGFHAYKGGNAPAGARDPVIETSHADGNCAIIGGYVYRGKAIPALQGAYLYSDSCKGDLTAAVPTGGRVQQQRVMTEMRQPTSFGEDPSGELYVVLRTGSVQKLTAS
jgi:glucose/arabinose dehydrogenase